MAVSLWHRELIRDACVTFCLKSIENKVSAALPKDLFSLKVLVFSECLCLIISWFFCPYLQLCPEVYFYFLTNWVDALKAYSFYRHFLNIKVVKADLRLQHTRHTCLTSSGWFWKRSLILFQDVNESLSLRCFWWPAPVLLGRWEGTCGKMKAICLDGTMSSVCCVCGKQLHLSRYDEPWTDITRRIHQDLQPPQSKSYRPLTCLFSVRSFHHIEIKLGTKTKENVNVYQLFQSQYCWM